jgi:hypothetical protein
MRLWRVRPPFPEWQGWSGLSESGNCGGDFHPRHFHTFSRRSRPARQRKNTVKNAVNSPCAVMCGEFSVSPLEHRRYTVTHGARAKIAC